MVPFGGTVKRAPGRLFPFPPEQCHTESHRTENQHCEHHEAPVFLVDAGAVDVAGPMDVRGSAQRKNGALGSGIATGLLLPTSEARNRLDSRHPTCNRDDRSRSEW